MAQSKSCHTVYACEGCGEAYADRSEALNCCLETIYEVTSCCHAEIGERSEKEYPLGRAEGHYYNIPVPCCTKCGKEVDE